MKLRRESNGAYRVVEHEDYAIVRTEHDVEDERYENIVYRRIHLWEASKWDHGAWTIGLIGYPVRTLREARTALAQDLEALGERKECPHGCRPGLSMRAMEFAWYCPKCGDEWTYPDA